VVDIIDALIAPLHIFKDASHSHNRVIVMATGRLTAAGIIRGGSGFPEAGMAGEILGGGAGAEEEEARCEGEGGWDGGGDEVRGRGEQRGDEAGV
jgi:hypothetical protein